MTLGEHPLGVSGIHDTIGRSAACLFTDVIVYRIQCLPAVNAAGVVPPQSVISGSQRGAGAGKIIAAPEQAKLFIEGVGNLALEGEAAGVDLRDRVLVIDRDGRIGGIRESLVAKNGVEIVQIAGCQNEGIAGGRSIDIRTDRK